MVHLSSGPCDLTKVTEVTQQGTVIQIATCFSAFPAGRVAEDGPFNGALFQAEHLKAPILAANASGTKVIVSLNGLMSCGSSFLDEAFAGLVRDGHITRKDLLNVLEVVYSEPHLKRFHDAIFRYIKESKPT